MVPGFVPDAAHWKGSTNFGTSWHNLSVVLSHHRESMVPMGGGEVFLDLLYNLLHSLFNSFNAKRNVKERTKIALEITSARNYVSRLAVCVQ